MKIFANPVSISVVVRAIPAQNALRMKPWLRNETNLRIAASALISALLSVRDWNGARSAGFSVFELDRPGNSLHGLLTACAPS